MCGLILIGLGLIVWGLLALFARDLLWSLWRFSYRMEGIASERTDLWELRMSIGGIVAILMGIFLILWSIDTSRSMPTVPTPIARYTPRVASQKASPTAATVLPSPTGSPTPTPTPLPKVLAERTDAGVRLHFITQEGETTVAAEGANAFTHFQVVGDRVYYENRYATREGVVVLPTPQAPGSPTTLVAADGSQMAWLFLDNHISLADRSGEAHYRLILTDGEGRHPHLVWERIATFYDNRGAALLAWRNDGQVLYLSQPWLGEAWCCFAYNPSVMALDVASGKTRVLGDEDAFDAAVSPDGAWLAQSFDGGEVRLRALDRDHERVFPGGEKAKVAGDFSFDPQGHWLAWLELTTNDLYRLRVVPLPDGEPSTLWQIERHLVTDEPDLAGWLGPDEAVMVIHKADMSGSSYRIHLPDGKPQRFSHYDFLGVLGPPLATALSKPAPIPDAEKVVKAVVAADEDLTYPDSFWVAWPTPGAFTAPKAEERLALVGGIGKKNEIRWVVVGHTEEGWELRGISDWLGTFPARPSAPPCEQPVLTDFDHDGRQEVLVIWPTMNRGRMEARAALYRWDGQKLARVWAAQTLLDNRLADPDLVHEPYRVVNRAEWTWVDLDGDGIDELRLQEHVAYYKPNAEGYVPDNAPPYQEEEKETVFQWNGSTLEATTP